MINEFSRTTLAGCTSSVRKIIQQVELFVTLLTFIEICLLGPGRGRHVTGGLTGVGSLRRKLLNETSDGTGSNSSGSDRRFRGVAW